jgi:photosystem II stability/assembly factor-like uncharacterized protein
MRMRMLVLAGLSAVVAGCGSGTLQATGGQATPSATGPASATAATAAATRPASSPPASPAGTGAAGAGQAGTAAAGAACSSPERAAVETSSLNGMQFVSPTQGWAVGQDTILATTDGGAHWATQLSGNLNLTSVDFISARDGWAAGATSLLATTDGGAHWAPLPEPCPIRSVHFISPSTGFAVAGGRELGGEDPSVPLAGGVVLATSDGGRSWHQIAAPADAQTVCFSDPVHGWLGADGLLYRTSNAGRSWTALTSMAGQAGKSGAGSPAAMTVQCANDGSAWALRIGPGAAMSQQAHVAFHADQAGATPIFAEQYFQVPGAKPAAQSPGSDPGAYSAIDSSTAVFVDACTACGLGTAPWDVASNSGATLAKEGNVGDINQPQAASFLSPEVGWVAGSTTATTTPENAQVRIVATTDGGRTWHVQHSSPEG